MIDKSIRSDASQSLKHDMMANCQQKTVRTSRQQSGCSCQVVEFILSIQPSSGSNPSKLLLYISCLLTSIELECKGSRFSFGGTSQLTIKFLQKGCWIFQNACQENNGRDTNLDLYKHIGNRNSSSKMALLVVIVLRQDAYFSPLLRNLKIIFLHVFTPNYFKSAFTRKIDSRHQIQNILSTNQLWQLLEIT